MESRTTFHNRLKSQFTEFMEIWPKVTTLHQEKKQRAKYGQVRAGQGQPPHPLKPHPPSPLKARMGGIHLSGPRGARSNVLCSEWQTSSTDQQEAMAQPLKALFPGHRRDSLAEGDLSAAHIMTTCTSPGCRACEMPGLMEFIWLFIVGLHNLCARTKHEQLHC